LDKDVKKEWIYADKASAVWQMLQS